MQHYVGIRNVSVDYDNTQEIIMVNGISSCKRILPMTLIMSYMAGIRFDRSPLKNHPHLVAMVLQLLVPFPIGWNELTIENGYEAIRRWGTKLQERRCVREAKLKI